MNTVTETSLQPLLPPSGSFLANYLEYAGALTDAPLAYHVLVGTALLASVAPADAVLTGLPGGRVLPNFWGVVVGRPAVEHKTTAVRIGTELLSQASPGTLGDMNGSLEGIQESLLPPYSTKLFEIGEFGDFLSQARGGYAEKLKPGLTKLFDGAPIDRRLSRAKRLQVANPRVSLIGAVNTSMLMEYATPNDWDGGFLSRFCVFQAHTERPDPEGTVNLELQRWLVDWLAWARTRTVAAGGGLTPQAREMWNAWNANFRDHLHQLPGDAKVAAYGRTPTQAAKMMLLHAMDYGTDIETQGWVIDEDVVGRCLGLAELHWQSIGNLSDLAYDSEEARMLRRFLSHVPVDGTPVAFGEVLKKCFILRRRGTELFETLVEMGLLTGRNVHGSFLLSRIVDTSGEEDAPADVYNLMGQRV